MYIPDKKADLEVKLESLSAKKRMAFALASAAHVLPRYQEWSEQEGKGWAEAKKLHTALEEAWHIVENPLVNPDLLRSQLAIVDRLIPDTEIFPEASGIGALDAACAVLEALECVKNGGNIEDTIQVGESALFASQVVIGRHKITDPTELEEFDEKADTLVELEWEYQLDLIKKLSMITDKSVKKDVLADLL